jgi:NitT/TauT family transport system substrate-binding protein
MKKTLSITMGLALSLMAGSALAADKLTLQLKWVTQGQFAGYYVAKDKGIYEEEGLDVDHQAGRPGHRASAGDRRWRRRCHHRLDALCTGVSREKGVPLVNIAQPFKKSGMMLTCRKETGITKPEDFKGKTLGVWFFGNEYPFLSWMSQLGIPTDGGDNGVDRAQAGLQRGSADPAEAGRLHLHHDLQ